MNGQRTGSHGTRGARVPPTISARLPAILWTAMVIALGFAGCARSSSFTPTAEVVVFAASSLTDAFREIASGFEAENPGTRVVLNFASSSQLARQLTEGAPADVFASASSSQMQVVAEEGRTTWAPQTFATNQLTVIIPADNPAGIDTLGSLRKAGIAIALASPGVPAREYTDRMVARLAADPTFGPAFASAFYANVVSEEHDVRQVAAKIALGEVDAGIVYVSDVTPDLAGKVRQVAIPEAFNVTATYPIATLGDAPNPEAGQAFQEYVLSADGQATLRRWGFGPKP